MPASDFKKTSALLQSMQNDIDKTSKALAQTAHVAKDWLKDIERMEKRCDESMKDLNALVTQFKESQRAVQQLRGDLMVLENTRLKSDQLLDNMRRKLSDDSDALSELRMNVEKKGKVAKEKPGDKKAQMEAELAERAFEKAQRDFLKSSGEFMQAIPSSMATDFVSAWETNRKLLRDYEECMFLISNFCETNRDSISSVVKEMRDSMGRIAK